MSNKQGKEGGRVKHGMGGIYEMIDIWKTSKPLLLLCRSIQPHVMVSTDQFIYSIFGCKSIYNFTTINDLIFSLKLKKLSPNTMVFVK